MSEQSDKRRSIQEELAKLHSIEEMRRNIDAIIAKTGASKSLVYLEINRQETTREAVVKTLFDLFVVRSDTYAMQMEDKSYVRIDRPLTIDILKEHLEGKMTIGGYQLDRENMVKWLCFDIDPTCIENPKEIARLIYQKCVENNRFPVKSVVLEASRHPDPSYHIWVFFGNPIPAFVAKFFGERILVFCGNPKVELFPKQTKLEKDGYGNLVKLPLGLHRQTKKWSYLLNPETFEPLPIESIFEVEGGFIREEDIEEIRRIAENEKPLHWFSRETEEKESYKGDIPPCIQKLLKGVEQGARNESGIRLACYLLNFCKVEPQKALTSLREWNARNKPPLSETELGIIFQSASRGNYNYGCDDPILKKFCSKGACPFSEKEPIEIRLSDMRAELDTFPVRVKVQVMGESNKKMCCKTVSVECLECGERQSYDLSSPKNYKLLLERLRHGQEGFRRRFQSTPLCDCEKAKRRIRFSGSLDYRLLYCQDVIDPKVKWEEKTYRTERLVLIGEPKEAVLKKVKIEGIVTAFRRDDITILIYKVEPLEKPIPSSTEGFDEYFRNNEDLIEDIDGSVQTYIRGRPIEKLLATLVLHSPYELIYEGERIRGALNDLQLGETKTGKSDILEWIETNVGGEGVRGETARRTGLGFSVDPEAKAIFWGVLPRCDKEVCMIDGLDHFDTEKELPQLREAMAKQILKVSMAVSGVALYRTRIIASANPRQRTFRKYTNMAEAIREFFNDPTLVTRWDFVVPFSREDVKAEEIAKARTTPPKIPLDVFRNHVFWAWNLEPEDIIFKDEAIEEIERLFIELQEYSSDSLPLVHAEYKRVLARVSASYAVLTHNVDELGKVNVTKEHITKAYDLLWGLLEEWEYNLYVAGERKEIEIEGAEWQELLSFLTGDVWKIFSSIANKKGLQRAVLLTMVDKSARTIDSYLDELKKRNLIEHAKGYRGGYQLMDKGIAVYRKMMSLLAEKEEMKNVEQPLAERILRITQIEKPEKGKCNYCGIEAVLCWQIEEFGVRELKRACSDCGQAILARFKEG